MAAVLRDTAFYDSAYVKKYLQDARDYGNRAIKKPFELTGLSPATLGDSYNLLVFKFGEKVVGHDGVTNGLGTSATVSVGDAGDADRYVVAGTSLATTGLRSALAVTGMGYKPTADTIVVLVGAGAAFTVGAVYKGWYSILPPG